MKPDTSRWRSSASYDYLDKLDAPDLAWEWLRRNTNYQQDYAQADRPSLKRELRRKWGLQFFCPAVAECSRESGVLVPRGRHQHRAPRTDTHRSAGGRQSLFPAGHADRTRGRRRHACPVRGGRRHGSASPTRRSAA
ncbi:transcriptional regulator domain-containing protein [Bosea sp. NPDC055332]